MFPGGIVVKNPRHNNRLAGISLYICGMKYPFYQSGAGNITVVSTNNLLVVFIRDKNGDVTSYIVTNPSNPGIFEQSVLEVEVFHNDTQDEILKKVDAIVKEKEKKAKLLL